MAKQLPAAVRQAIKEAVYRKADEFGYTHKSRVDSGLFMENLVKDKDVGKVLADYMPKADIKTYIKDAVLNRYSKDKKSRILPSDPEGVCDIAREAIQQEASVIDRLGSVFLLRLDDNDLLLVSQGTLLKWETALRKALEFVAKAPGLPPDDVKLHILLNIAVLGRPLTQADRDHLTAALKFVGVKLHFSDH
ncbi:MAG: hypothetical protein M0Z61_15170 [Nitrospiraceae bacterium]|nr:hypothetical protein [Nitrospiraceae bacterium]